jgi:2-hydroxymuconate-semialdehyde hydrolase
LTAGLVDVGAGTAVLLLHGTAPGTTAVANFSSLLPALSGYRAIAPDFLGFGASAKPPGLRYGPNLWVEQAFALADDLALDRLVVVGNSMGARVALTMAVQQPRRISGMVLMSPRLRPSRSAAQELIRAYRPDPAAMAHLLRTCFATDPASVTEQMIADRYRDSAAPGAHAALQAMFGELSTAGLGPSHDLIAALRIPSLVIAGRDDRVVPHTDAVELAGLLTNSDLHVLGGTGHWFALERAETFNALVLDFLRRLR